MKRLCYLTKSMYGIHACTLYSTTGGLDIGLDIGLDSGPMEQLILTFSIDIYDSYIRYKERNSFQSISTIDSTG